MSYEPTQWSAGDTVTSAKLNKLEQGIANSILIVHSDMNGVLDKTWQEINDADISVIINRDNNNTTKNLMFIMGTDRIDDQEYQVYGCSYDGELMNMLFTAISPDSYPAIDWSTPSDIPPTY